MHRPVLILGLAVLALATVVSRKPWLTPKRLIYRTHVLRLDDALGRMIHQPARDSVRFPITGVRTGRYRVAANMRSLFSCQSA
ncbi:hypothetical protein Pla52n_66000 [Stieleria varia]|uniref:Uncharacterized protein n=1 Tax=Stieleria varia TaxID=2528005 RepID=A0A5C5ZW56_9BACT|nr:hypothetical protein Pla52n_66000 [Stieleria varia]